MRKDKNKATTKALEAIAADQDKNAPIRERKEAEAKAKAQIDTLPPLIPLGRRGALNYYWANVDKSIVALKASEHKADNLEQLAPVVNWAQWVNPDAPAKVLQDMKASAVFSKAKSLLFSQSVGKKFDPSRVRMRGMWIDDNTQGLIYNMGDGCYLSTSKSPKPQLVTNVRGPHIYDTGVPIPAPAKEPLSYPDGRKLIKHLEARSWKMANSGVFLAGWAVCGLLGGALRFRPHVWINAPAGSGKTSLRDDLKCCFGGDGGGVLSIEGTSSESGVRRSLDGASLPVIGDEMEPSQGNEKLMDLVRIATIGGDKVLADMSGGGKEATFRIKSSFLLISIQNQLDRDSDRSRFLQLRLLAFNEEKAEDKAMLEQILKEQEEGRRLVNSPQFTGQFITRLMLEFSAMQANIITLEERFRREGAKPRRAELMAHILAGAHALTHGGEMSPQDITRACALVQAYAEQETVESDAGRALEELLAYQVRMDGIAQSIAQLIGRLRAIEDSPNIDTIDETERIKTALEAYRINWWKTPEEEHFMLWEPLRKIGKEIFRDTPFRHGKMKDVFMEGSKDGEASPKGIQWRSVRAFGSPCYCLAFPERLIFPDT